MSNDLLKSGRTFLVLLSRAEENIRKSESTYYPSLIVLQIRNWIYVLAFIIRKLSAALEGTTDYDFEIRNPIFILKNENGGSL